MRVQAAPNGHGELRLGLSVPGMASAVDRNRVRRRLREAARVLGEPGGFDLVVSTDATALRVPFELLREQVRVAALSAMARARAARDPGERA